MTISSSSLVTAVFACLIAAALGTPTAVFAQIQSPAQVGCLGALAKAEAKLVKTQGKEVSGCVKGFAAGKLASCQTAEGCLRADGNGKVAKVSDQLRFAEEKSCAAEEPDFGVAEPFKSIREIRFHLGALSADLFGAALDTTLATKSLNSEVAACQGKVAKSVQKIFDARMAGYTKCKSVGFEEGSITSNAGLEGCRSSVRTAETKVAKAIDKLGLQVTKGCAGVDADIVFPGKCSGAADLAACIDAQARCRFCRMTNVLDDLSGDCDLYDDSASNDSCQRADGRCNGSSLLCDRAFDAVSFPTSHNAFSNADEGWAVPNQRHGLTRQLEDGVRALMLDTHYYAGAAHLCHESCDFNEQARWREPLLDGLVRVREFLDDHTDEVVSLIFESYISEANTAAAMAAAGLAAYAHEQAVGAPWPTLQQLIDSGKRLVVFTDDASATLPWHHYVWDFAWETHYSFSTVSNFSCAINRGSMDNSLFILNHFLTGPFGGSEKFASKANISSVFLPRAEQCQSQSGRLPNFVTVDFFDIGALFEVVDTLNQVGTCKP